MSTSSTLFSSVRVWFCIHFFTRSEYSFVNIFFTRSECSFFNIFFTRLECSFVNIFFTRSECSSGVSMFLDLHGHSQKTSAFFYGQPPTTTTVNPTTPSSKLHSKRVKKIHHLQVYIVHQKRVKPTKLHSKRVKVRW